MSDTILNSQIKSSGKFFSSGNKYDIYDTEQAGSVVAPVALNQEYVTSISTEAYGSYVEYDLPSSTGLHELFLECTFGSNSSGNYCKWPAVALIESLELRSANNIIEQFDFAAVWYACYSKLGSQVQNELLTLAGSTSFASGVCGTFIPLFFTNFAQSFMGNTQKHAVPLNTSVCQSRLRLRLKFRAGADILASGASGAGTISTKLYCLTSQTTTELQKYHMDKSANYLYPCNTFQTLPAMAISSGTATLLDISALRGSVSSILVSDRLVSNISTAHDYLTVENDINNLYLMLDSKKYWESTSEVVAQMSRLLFSEYAGQNVTLGDSCDIAIACMYESSNFTGALETENISKIQLGITSSLGANGYIYVIATQNAFVTVDGGVKFVMNS